MKSVLVALILGFGTFQTVSFVQCCCGPLCSTPGELCRDHDHKSRTRKPCTACGKHLDEHSTKSSKLPGKDMRCTHISPTSELGQTQIVDIVHAPQMEIIAVELPGLLVNEVAHLPLREVVPRPNRERRPIFLLDSAFLI
jgi:hypothetical protein